MRTSRTSSKLTTVLLAFLRDDVHRSWLLCASILTRRPWGLECLQNCNLQTPKRGGDKKDCHTPDLLAPNHTATILLPTANTQPKDFCVCLFWVCMFFFVFFSYLEKLLTAREGLQILVSGLSGRHSRRRRGLGHGVEGDRSSRGSKM